MTQNTLLQRNKGFFNKMGSFHSFVALYVKARVFLLGQSRDGKAKDI